MRIAVVGGGVAGAAAGVLLRKLGVQVKGYDMLKGYTKPCGEVVPAWLPRLAGEASLPVPRVLNSISTFVFMSADRVLRRIEFDEAVWVSIDKSGWVNAMRSEVPFEKEAVASPEKLLESFDVVMDARGPFASRGRRILVWRAYAEVPVDEAIIVFGPGLTGLAWIFPHGNGSNIGGGFVETSRPREASLPLLEGAARSLGYSGLGTVWGDSYSLVTVWPRIDLGSPRIPRLGEAAGLVNSLGGEGIRPALLSGVAAARAYAEAEDPLEAWRRYAEEARALVVEAKLASMLLSFSAVLEPSLLLSRLPISFYRAWLGGRLGLGEVLRALAAAARQGRAAAV